MPDNQKSWDRESIHELLARNDRAVERALLVLLNRQTTDEQNSERTIHRNGQGFAGLDADIFTSFAKQVAKGRRLTPRQLAVCRKPSKRFKLRIGKYWKQLIEAIEENKS